ncbi:MAG: hypothetical protein HY046_04775 [Acidobacteria bacterium]|nr:hypothetical protein [Acidobacteriota bacterium]
MKSYSIQLRLRVVAIGLTTVFALTASAQNSRLSSVKILGSKNYSEAQMIPATGLTIGSAINKEELQAAADRLSQLGSFHNVRFTFKSQGDNVAVTFELQDTALVPVSFDNFPWYSDEEIIATIRAA